MSCDAINVIIKIKPTNSQTYLVVDRNNITATDRQQFSFDRIVEPEVLQKEFYEQHVKPIVSKLNSNKNVCVFTYGQTGSGKTFTMGLNVEKANNQLSGVIPHDWGLLPRAILDIFKQNNEPDVQYNYRITFVEIYNEECRDLLNNGARLFIREAASGIVIQGQSRFKVNRATDCFKYLSKGIGFRQTCQTSMNESSSRSHAIFTLIYTKNFEHNHPKFPNNETVKINFVDLAGSERLNRTNTIGHRAKEGIAINKSLLALSQVINALSDKKPFIPYRDSNLTMFLKESLSGSGQTLMIACITLDKADYHETLSTLQYANRAKNIKRSAPIRAKSAPVDLYQEILKQNAELKARILALHNDKLLRESVVIDRKAIIEISSSEVDELFTLAEEIDSAIKCRFDILDKYIRLKIKNQLLNTILKITDKQIIYASLSIYEQHEQCELDLTLSASDLNDINENLDDAITKINSKLSGLKPYNPLNILPQIYFNALKDQNYVFNSFYANFLLEMSKLEIFSIQFQTFKDLQISMEPLESFFLYKAIEPSTIVACPSSMQVDKNTSNLLVERLNIILDQPRIAKNIISKKERLSLSVKVSPICWIMKVLPEDVLSFNAKTQVAQVHSSQKRKLPDSTFLLETTKRTRPMSANYINLNSTYLLNSAIKKF